MTDLKTLKDLHSFRDHYDDKPYRKLVMIDELKAEAIKWVKKYKNSINKLTLLHEAKAAEIFMTFFNLTEEEIK